MRVLINQYPVCPSFLTTQEKRNEIRDYIANVMEARLSSGLYIKFSSLSVFFDAESPEELYINPLPGYKNIIVHMGKTGREAPEMITKENQYIYIDKERNAEEIGRLTLQSVLWDLTDKLNKDEEKKYEVGGELFEQEIKKWIDSKYNDRLNHLKTSVQDYSNKISLLRKQLSENIAQYNVASRELLLLQDNEKNHQSVLENIQELKDLDKIKSVTIKDGVFTFQTKQLAIHNPRTDKYYDGGEFTVKVVLDNNDVRIFSTVNRPSYWSDEDPHPHVSGEDNSPCLGDSADPIAELCGTDEFYGLAMVILSFLETVNDGDIAGRNIMHWDEIDPETFDIINTGANPEDTVICERCEEIVHEDDAYYVDRRDGRYCGECFEEISQPCDNCHSDVHIDDIHQVDGGDVEFCEDCINSDTVTCDACSEQFTPENIYADLTDGGNICGHCAENLGMEYDEEERGYRDA